MVGLIQYVILNIFNVVGFFSSKQLKDTSTHDYRISNLVIDPLHRVEDFPGPGVGHDIYSISSEILTSNVRLFMQIINLYFTILHILHNNIYSEKNEHSGSTSLLSVGTGESSESFFIETSIRSQPKIISVINMSL